MNSTFVLDHFAFPFCCQHELREQWKSKLLLMLVTANNRDDVANKMENEKTLAHRSMINALSINLCGLAYRIELKTKTKNCCFAPFSSRTTTVEKENRWHLPIIWQVVCQSHNRLHYQTECFFLLPFLLITLQFCLNMAARVDLQNIIVINAVKKFAAWKMLFRTKIF